MANKILQDVVAFWGAVINQTHIFVSVVLIKSMTSCLHVFFSWIAIHAMHGCCIPSLLVLKPEYTRISRSIPWLLMTWLLMSPGHQQPCYWLWTTNRSLSSIGRNFKYLHHPNFGKWYKMQIDFYVSSKIYSAQYGLLYRSGSQNRGPAGCYTWLQSSPLNSLSSKVTKILYLKSSWGLEAARLGVKQPISLWNFTVALAALQLGHLSNFIAFRQFQDHILQLLRFCEICNLLIRLFTPCISEKKPRGGPAQFTKWIIFLCEICIFQEYLNTVS